MVERTTVTTPDGLGLAVEERGDRAAPTIVAVHGYPDDRHVWDGVAHLLATDHHVVSYDVRGHGDSDAPADRAGYDLELLAADLRAVCDAVSPGEPVHLLAHDWGAIQTWHAVTGDALTGRVASFTSISGPSLDHVGLFLRRRSPRDLRSVVRQGLHSWYTLAFRLPVLPELLCRSGAIGRLLERTERIPRPSVRDGVNGLELYRRNLPRRLGRPEQRRTDVPVQILAPRGDAYVMPALATSAAQFAPDLRVRYLPGGHWIVRHRPEVIARCTAEMVAGTAAPARPAPALTRAAARGRALVASDGRSGRAVRWEGGLAVVTGAGSGIGRATALALADRGTRVVVADLSADGAAGTAGIIERRHGTGRAFAETVDVAVDEAVAGLAARVAAEHGVPDLVVNNAGIAVAGPFADITAEEWRRIVDVNLWGVVHGCRHFGALLREHGEGGHLVNVASAAAYLPSRALPAYATTKAAVLMLSECLRAELAEEGVGVTALCPGFVDTPITAHTRFAGTDDATQDARRRASAAAYARRGYTPDRVASRLIRAVERNVALAPVTAEAHAGLLASRLSPGLLRAVARIDAGTR
ncbi:short-subunit dehydrogenase [Pseudonocardia autotrophica]|uniref:Putative oxidoreductase n=1 Tax=Pseudonocardia autotrophica TaxID=2074 RepID=A0A1Y2MRJ1_PSEAH|nr:putative oxidoreductase [Pseudonocardia autotrophica]TDN72492.1 short-subunit dehydrogenase [Pseudonocardia autotrophica]